MLSGLVLGLYHWDDQFKLNGPVNASERAAGGQAQYLSRDKENIIQMKFRQQANQAVNINWN